MKKIIKIKGMHCNSCAQLIENKLKGKVGKIKVSFADERAEIEFDGKITEKDIIKEISKLGYRAEIVDEKEDKGKRDMLGWIIMGGSVILLIFILYFFFGSVIRLPDVRIPEISEKTSLILLFAAGILTGFHCIAMCGGFVVSYTAKNAINGHRGFKQHLVYGGGKVVSYTIIGGLFGLIGGFISFSIGLRGTIAILAGIFMILYSLSMMGFKFFRKFQFNPKFLTKIATSNAGKFDGKYSRPLVIGLLNGLFIACGPLQAMYLYATGTGSALSGAMSLAAFGLGTLPIMLGFGGLTSVISHKATGKILKISAVIVLILGLIMVNRGLALTGSPISYESIKAGIIGTNGVSGAVLNDGKQVIDMQVDSSGYTPNSFVLKKGVPVKWNVNVKELTGCNQELVMNQYDIDVKLKSGLNVIEFTPDKTGTISFTCGMGMLRGSFIVTETGLASQQEVQAATPKSSGGCGCGGMK